VVFLEGNNLEVFYYHCASEIWPYKRGGLWWEWPYKRGGLWWEWPDKRGGLWWEWPYKRGGLWWEEPYLRGTTVQMYQKMIVPSRHIIIGI
jgi:hypothetical protein